MLEALALALLEDTDFFSLSGIGRLELGGCFGHIKLLRLPVGYIGRKAASILRYPLALILPNTT